jgi:glycosyltransferase involved in cell wall biosynthesis
VTPGRGAPPGILFDISRLYYRRLTRRLPTGIDRVGLEYIRHYGNRARAMLGAGPFVSVLSVPDSGRAFRALLETGATRGELAALAGKAYLRWWAGPGTADALLLNTSHTGLHRARYALSLRRRGARPVFFVHDLIPITHPEYCRRGERDRHISRMRTAVTVGRGIIVPSRYTLETLARFCGEAGLELPPAVVAPLASTLPRLAPGPRPLAQPYFAVVGTVEPRKNHALLLELWRALVERAGAAAPHLVVIGQRGWDCDEAFAAMRAPALAGHVHALAGAGDRELTTWLAHAQALLFPSFVEGYGLPLAEALAMGVPAITSDLAVFREVAGDIPEYAGPRDTGRWLKLVEDYGAPQGALRPAQLARLAGFRATTWQRHFEQVDDFLQRL